MAGSLPGLALTQRVDGDGNPLIGGRLFLYEAGTTTPATAYKDFNLTAGQEHPFPIELDAFGQIPNFYLADGSYRARLTNSTGSVVLFDIYQIQAVGEAGGSGTPPTIDQTTIFTTGMIDWDAVDETRTGWVRLNGRTIGNASSGATERANADTQSLFERNWAKYSDSICAVSGGRGASAAADFAAGKTIALLNMRFLIPVGLDTMGNTAASRATGVPAVSGDAATPASVLGGATTTLIQAELPAFKPGITITDPGHTHSFSTVFGAINSTASGSADVGAGVKQGAIITATIGTSTTGISAALTNNLGSGSAHNNTPLVMPGTYYQKL